MGKERNTLSYLPKMKILLYIVNYSYKYLKYFNDSGMLWQLPYLTITMKRRINSIKSNSPTLIHTVFILETSKNSFL